MIHHFYIHIKKEEIFFLFHNVDKSDVLKKVRLIESSAKIRTFAKSDTFSVLLESTS